MTTEITAQEYRALLKKGQRKYSAARVLVDGYRFDSQAEADRYAELRLLLTAGQIQGLRVHPPYELQPSFRDRQGRRVGAIVYQADFAYTEVVTALKVTEDVKGCETAAWKIKEKLFRYRYPEVDLRVLRV